MSCRVSPARSSNLLIPDAVMRGAHGYARLGLRMQNWDEWDAANWLVRAPRSRPAAILAKQSQNNQ
jgi:hypothetical protein